MCGDSHPYVGSGHAFGHVMFNGQLSMKELSGGYCSGVPPLPIPNREVKPACADGTAMQCGRVGGRHLYSESPDSEMSQGFFCCWVLYLPSVTSKTSITSITSMSSKTSGLYGLTRLGGPIWLLV